MENFNLEIFNPEPKKTFEATSQARIDFLKKLKAGSHVHVLGACGTGMGSVVCLLKQLGFYVSGSDKSFYPPMGDFIKEYADELFEQYSIENLKKKPDFVVIGNALSRGNPELEEVLAQNIPFSSMAELLSALLITDRFTNPRSVVVAGTHGKTTTTALLAHALTELSIKPAYFFGGVPTGLVLKLPIMPFDGATPIDQRVSVIEGDEYDSAFFAKYSKFQCYRPDIAVITNVEFDHGDIFQSIEEIESQFLSFLEKIPSSGYIVACLDAPGAKKVVLDFKQKHPKGPKVVWYGEDQNADFSIVRKEIYASVDNKSFTQVLTINCNGKEQKLETNLTGAHNALNLTAVLSVLSILGVKLDKSSSAIKTFSNVKRRQQIHIASPKIVLVEDFAHHPTEVFYTLRGIKEAYPNNRLVAIFEPRSNTSRRAFFREDYIRSLEVADIALIKEVDQLNSGYAGVSADKAFLNVKELVSELCSSGVESYSAFEVDDLFKKTINIFKQGDVIVVMSNGEFAGLIKRLLTWGQSI